MSAVAVSSFLPGTLEKVVSNYIAKELMPNNWTIERTNICEDIQNLIDESNGKLRMFSSGALLARRIFTDFAVFPRSMEKFGVDVRDQYKIFPKFFMYGKDTMYVYKHDILSMMYKSIENEVQKYGESDFLMDGISFYLSSFGQKFFTNAELSMYPENEISALAETVGKVVTDSECNQREVKDEEVEEILKEMRSWNLKSEDVRQSFNAMIATYFSTLSIKKFNRAIKWIKYATEWIGVLIEEHSECFKPRNLVAKQSKPVVRLFAGKFKGKSHDVVMVHELLESMKQGGLDVSSFESEALNMPKLSTWEFREFLPKIGGKNMQKIAFLRLLPSYSMFRAVPIPTIDGGYCIQAADAVFQLLHDMIVAKKVFHIMERDQLSLLDNFFESIEKYLYPSDQIYFIDLKDVDSIMNEWDNFFELNFKNSRKVAKNIRNIRQSFSKEDNINVLAYLGLDQVFPEITKYAKDGTGTQWMYHNVHESLFISIVETFPKILSLIHNQKSCGRLLNYSCTLCKKETEEKMNKANEHVSNAEVEEKPKIEADSQVETPVADGRTESKISVEVPEHEVIPIDREEIAEEAAKLKDKKKKKKTKAFKKDPVAESDETSSEASSDSEKSASESKETEKKKKTKPIKKECDVKPETCQVEKESQTCPKCARASEYTRATNEKLRLERIEKKHLKKQLAEVEKMQQDDKEMIKRLEQKLLEQEQQFNVALQMKNEEIELLKNQLTDQESQIEDVIKINEENDEIINDLRTREPEIVPVTVEAIRPQEETEKVEAHLSKLLQTKETLKTEEPVKKFTEIVGTLTAKTHSKEIQQLAQTELKVYQLQCFFYEKVLEGNIKLIQENKHVTLEQIPKLIDFPEFSNEFKNAYKKSLKKTAPVLCKSLLKSSMDLADPECLICLVDMTAEEETSKCEKCRRRYHECCIKQWFETKRSCPTCNTGMLDDEEFPELS